MAWKKLKLLGAGNYASVYLAAEKKKKLIAVKSAAITRKASISSLQVEKDMLQQLRGCPYIIQALGYDVSLEDGNLVHNLLLEFAGFGSLSDIINNYSGKMPESVVALYAYMILKGLAILHEKDIVHGDIKPDNILAFDLLYFGDGGDNINFLKLADFGGSKKVCDGRPRTFTLMYASPESLTCNLQEKPSDIWAFGCTVVKMITGKPLWNSCNRMTRAKLLKKIINESPEIPKGLSEKGIHFLKRCLAKDHSKRWTADMLLNHPFIVENLKSSGIETLLRQEEVEAAAKAVDMPWTSTRDLFSESSSDGRECIPFKKFVLDLSKNCFVPQ